MAVPLRAVLVPILAFSLVLGASAWTAGDFPNPERDFTRCRRNSPSALCDPDNLLGREAADVTMGLINAIALGEAPYRKAPCGQLGYQGFQVGTHGPCMRPGVPRTWHTCSATLAATQQPSNPATQPHPSCSATDKVVPSL